MQKEFNLATPPKRSRMRGTAIILSALIGLASCTARLSAQVLDPLPPLSKGDCPGPDFFWPGHGYVPLGSIHDGIVVTIVHVFRYSGGDNDQDWNFVIRPVDKAGCPDGKKMFGRDCAAERKNFLNIFWNAATPEWRAQATVELAKFGERSTLTPAEAAIADQIAQAASQIPEFAEGLVAAGHTDIGFKMWGAVQLDPAKFQAFTAFAADRTSNVEAEVQIDDLDPDEEGQDIADLKTAADLAECDAGAGLCRAPALFYGTAVADTKHEGGKPELHPARALVTANLADEDAAKPFYGGNYKVRVFADYGKAADAGGGSLGGRICENWVDNRYDGGNYLSYVSIRPDTFVVPAKPTSDQIKGSGLLYEPACRVTALDKRLWNGQDEGLQDFAEQFTDRDLSSCPTFAANPKYRDTDEEHRLYGGWGVATVETKQVLQGTASNSVTVQKPVSLGLVKAGEPLGGGKAPYTAHWWRVPATSKVQLSGKELPIKSLAWNVPGPAYAVNPKSSGNDKYNDKLGNLGSLLALPFSVDIYVPVAPLKGGSLKGYDFEVASTATTFKDETITSWEAAVSVPHPTTSLARQRLGSYTYEVVNTGGQKSLLYKPSLKATSADFATAPSYSWWVTSPPPGKQVGQLTVVPIVLKLGDGPTITLAIRESDRSTYELRATDAYERASAELELEIPHATVDAPAELQVKGGQSAPGVLTKMSEGGAAGALCLATATTPVVFHSEVKLQAKMFIPPNPYHVPPPTAPQYQWGKVEKRVAGKEEWVAFPDAAVSGANNDTLVVTAGSTPTDDFSQLNEFRVILSAQDDYGRSASETIYFNNWDAPGLVTSVENCISNKYFQITRVPPWNWGILDPLRTPRDPIRDAGNPLRSEGVLARANLFLNPAAQKGTFAPVRSRAVPSGRRIDVPRLIARGVPRSERRALGPAITPAAYGLRIMKKDIGPYLLHLQMERIRQMAPLLR
ncbi:MAG: hypothetical protein ABR563_06100 [Pyrinomonadaceae bacterium]